MDTSLLVIIGATIGLLIVGAFAFLLGKLKAMKAELDQIDSNKRTFPANPDVQVMSIPMGYDKPVSPRIIEIEQELDKISSKLDSEDGNRPKIEERQALEDRYNSLIGEMVSHFMQQVDHVTLSNSLSGDHNVREERERVQGTQEVKTDVGKTARTSVR